MVERFSATSRKTNYGAAFFHDAEELIMAFGEYIDKQNQRPKPFI